MWSVRVGDLVVCIKKDPWCIDNTFHISIEQIPYGTICTVESVERENNGLYFSFSGWPHIWNSVEFRPVTKPNIENLRKLTTKPDLVKEDA